MRNPLETNSIECLVSTSHMSHTSQDLAHYILFLYFFPYFSNLVAFQKLIRMQ